MTRFEKKALVELLNMFSEELKEKGNELLELELREEKLKEVKRWVRELAILIKED